MSSLPSVELISESEYWAREKTSPTQHEFFNGHLRAMELGSHRHALIRDNVVASVKTSFFKKPIEVRGSQQRIKVDAVGLSTYADAVIFRLPAKFEGETHHTLLSPHVIFEVLSDSSREYDIGDKFRTYMLLQTLSDYVLVDQEHVEVTHFHRTTDGWLLKSQKDLEDTLAFPDLGVEISLQTIYAGTGLRERD